MSVSCRFTCRAPGLGSYRMVNKPVVALDIDGTLGDYHGHFTKFAEAWVGRELPDPNDINPGLPLYKHLGISKPMYRRVKLAYRQGGMKRSMPCYEGSSELTRHIRRSGAEVWICTTRPYLRFDGIDPDTRHWLRRNGIQWDGVLYGERKYRQLIESVKFDRIILVVDDLPEMCKEAERLKLPWVMRAQPYNRHLAFETGDRLVLDNEGIRQAFGRAMYQWNEDPMPIWRARNEAW